MNRILYRICCFLLIISSCAWAEDNYTNSFLSDVNNIRSIVNWNAGGENKFVCIFTEQRNLDATIKARQLTIYGMKNQEYKNIFEFDTLDYLLSMYPLGESGSRFYTAWVGGSAYHFRIFAFLENKIVKVFEDSSRTMPEFASDNNNNEVILITRMGWDNKHHRWEKNSEASTNIYKWEVNKYRLIKTVPWQNRFKYLK